MVASAPVVVSAARILVVEDEPKVRAAVAEGLAMEDWTVKTAANGREALQQLRREPFDLVVLDWMLPDIDGLGVIAEARRAGTVTPVLMVTARATVHDRVAGLDNGADDYLAKPFAFSELVARCRALLRRSTVGVSPGLTCGDIRLDTRARVARRGGTQIALTPLEVDVLEYLMRRQGQIVTREMLSRDVWRNGERTASMDNAINIHVVHLRQKLEEHGGRKLIHTEHGVGYRME